MENYTTAHMNTGKQYRSMNRKKIMSPVLEPALWHSKFSHHPSAANMPYKVLAIPNPIQLPANTHE